MTSPLNIFRDFLRSENILFADAQDLSTLINVNFHLLNEELFRSLITRAIAARDTNKNRGVSENDLLGDWGIVIDAIKVSRTPLNLSCNIYCALLLGNNPFQAGSSRVKYSAPH